MTVLDIPVRDLEQKQDRLASAIEAETRFGVGATFRNRRAHEEMDADWIISPSRRSAIDATSASARLFSRNGTETSR
jgi:tRNA-splicing ligase RtcB (3'-phosphate/5'-hydroxy nucleic acid ligase)